MNYYGTNYSKKKSKSQQQWYKHHTYTHTYLSVQSFTSSNSFLQSLFDKVLLFQNSTQFSGLHTELSRLKQSIKPIALVLIQIPVLVSILSIFRSICPAPLLVVPNYSIFIYMCILIFVYVCSAVSFNLVKMTLMP